MYYLTHVLVDRNSTTHFFLTIPPKITLIIIQVVTSATKILSPSLTGFFILLFHVKIHKLNSNAGHKHKNCWKGWNCIESKL